MARYMIHAFCDDCSVTHSMGVSVVLNDGPPEKTCVATLFAGRAVPPNLGIMLRNGVKCPKTGRIFQQTDNNKIYISPTPG
ncbi:MAG: hypothetical protein ABSC02_04910 [Acidobacteriota bacterium]